MHRAARGGDSKAATKKIWEVPICGGKPVEIYGSFDSHHETEEETFAF